jgi:hypothetical protein
MPPSSGPRAGFRARVTDHLAVAVGTTKGLFLVSDGVPDGPWFKGQEVPAFTQVEPGELYLAATTDPRYGTSIQVSEDGAVSWRTPAGRPIAFPDDTPATLQRVWQLHVIHPGAGVKPIVLAGTDPAALFVSRDLGESFSLIRPLWDHPHREKWEPGGGGLALHTIVTHPERPGRIIVGISAGGVYRSDDSGATWEPKNDGIAASHLPEVHPAFGQCVHKIATDAESPDMLWLQSHGGVYRSTDAGDHWTDVGRPGEVGGLPADFGFPIVTHPTAPRTAFVFPLESAEYRCSPQGACRVYRTEDGGASWEPLTSGLPQVAAHITVLRDAFDAGANPPYPLVFGTRTGQIYASGDGGGTWRLFADHLPPILCVRVLA